ncbi:hypothetical protein DITRI_Ditri13aG0024700 [Diplodiscus trichospermus]
MALIIFLICFAFLFSVPKDHDLLLSTYDFRIVEKQSRVAVFFMFNVIIISILFIGSLKPSHHNQDAAAHEFTSSPALEHSIDAKGEENNAGSYDGDGDDIEDLDLCHGYDGYDADHEDDLDTEEDDLDCEEDEKVNDLDRRIEEFIAEVTRKWREELLTESERLLCITAS